MLGLGMLKAKFMVHGWILLSSRDGHTFIVYPTE
jgi:hypothetical protein